jgi:tetratricopeptide (TPR) repeat protein
MGVATIADIFALALQNHQAGNLQLAEQIYLQVIQCDCAHADAHHLLGVLAYQTGRFDQAVLSIGRALALNPSAGIYHSNLGLVRQALGQMAEALASLREAVRLQPQSSDAHNALGDALRVLGNLNGAAEHCRLALRYRPDFPEAHNNLGNVLLEQGMDEVAVAHFHEAIRLRATFPEPHNNLANAHLRQGKADDAMTHCRVALRYRPDFAEAHDNLGTAHMYLGQTNEAIACFREALRLNPNFASAWGNLGNALARQENFEEAISCYQKANRLNPSDAKASNNLGNVFEWQNKLEEATRHYEQALLLEADCAETYSNLATVHMRQGQTDKAFAAFDRALDIDPKLSGARLNRAQLHLLLGDFEQGWPDWELRTSQSDEKGRHFTEPRWDGSDLNGKTILLHAERGLGDTLQFIRYAPLVKARGVTVVVECQPELLPLLASVAGIDQLVGSGSPLPSFDIQAPLLSLPGILHTQLSSIPASIPYLQAASELVKCWRAALTTGVGRSFKVGIAWQGNAAYRYDRQRSIPMKHFGMLAQLGGVELISLQKGPAADQLATLKSQLPIVDLGRKLDETAGAFMDTAAVMMNIDLVITSDTAIAHLAGALGVPVWVALPLVPDWRWLLEREDSPWYPTMRLFRQRRPGRWEDVFERIAFELKNRQAHG